MGFKEGLQNFFHREGAAIGAEKENQPKSESGAQDNSKPEHRVGDEVIAWDDKEGKDMKWTVYGASKDKAGLISIFRDEVGPTGIRERFHKDVTPFAIREGESEANELSAPAEAEPSVAVDKESAEQPEAGREYQFGDKVRVFSRTENQVLDWEVDKQNQDGSLLIGRTLPDGRRATKTIRPEDIVEEEEQEELAKAA